MFTLSIFLVALAQPTSAEELTPPPLVSAPTTTPVAEGGPTLSPTRQERSASLLDDSPRGRRLKSLLPLPGPSLVARAFTATLGTGLGAGVSMLLVLGWAAGGGGLGGGTSAALDLLFLIVPVVHALVSAGTALGAAFFGADFDREFGRALPVAVAVDAVASLVLFASFAIGLWAVPLACLVAGVATPLFIELARSIERQHEERRLGVVLTTF